MVQREHFDHDERWRLLVQHEHEQEQEEDEEEEQEQEEEEEQEEEQVLRRCQATVCCCRDRASRPRLRGVQHTLLRFSIALRRSMSLISSSFAASICPHQGLAQFWACQSLEMRRDSGRFTLTQTNLRPFHFASLDIAARASCRCSVSSAVASGSCCPGSCTRDATHLSTRAPVSPSVGCRQDHRVSLPSVVRKDAQG
eukprot:1996789-Rhodomonas_salina.3